MNPACPRCGAGCSIRHGTYYREDDAQTITRYRCKSCRKCHSSATHTPTYRQKRRRLNREIATDIVFCTSQRGIARKHRCARKTVARKLKFLAAEARKQHARWLKQQDPAEHVQWDELITYEHTRLKPLSVAVMVTAKQRAILGFGVAQIPASGLIAKRSVEKYGKRRDKSATMRKRVIKGVVPHLAPSVLIESDEHERYPAEFRSALPESTHVRYPSVRGSLTGQGELKRTAYDPLFRINHTLAMLRENLKRLTKITWCGTKKPEMLEDVLAIYCCHHNSRLINEPARTQP